MLNNDFLHLSVDTFGLHENVCPSATDTNQIKLNFGATRSEEVAIDQGSTAAEVPQPRFSIMMFSRNMSLSSSES